MAANFGMFENVVPLLAPFDRAGTLLQTPYLDLKGATRASFLLYFGVVTSTTATDELTMTLEASTASTSNASEEAIPFQYRVSAAFATGNTWGAITDATSAGFSMGASTVFDGFMLMVDLDPAKITLKKEDARYVRLVGTHTDAYSVMLVTCVGIIEPSYKQTTMIVATVT